MNNSKRFSVCIQNPPYGSVGGDTRHLRFVDNPNPTLYTEVHHIDGDKLNNNADNLTWVTRHENLGKPKTEYQILRTYLLNSIHNLFHEANEKGLDLTNVVNEILMFSKDVIATNSVNNKIEVR